MVSAPRNPLAPTHLECLHPLLADIIWHDSLADLFKDSEEFELTIEYDPSEDE